MVSDSIQPLGTGFFPLSTNLWRLFQVVVNINSFSLLLNSTTQYGWSTDYLTIHPLKDIWVVCPLQWYVYVFCQNLMELFVWHVFANIYLHSAACLLIDLMESFTEQKFLTFLFIECLLFSCFQFHWFLLLCL